MIDHISFSVINFTQSMNFYDQTRELLGITRLMTFETHEHKVADYGKDDKPFLLEQYFIYYKKS